MSEFQLALLMFIIGFILTVATTAVIIKGHRDTKHLLDEQGFYESDVSTKRDI